MTKTSIRFVASGTLLAISMACSGVTPPTAPSPPAEQLPTPAPTPPPTHIPKFPAISQPARVYIGTSSRYVLYDDGTFALQYSTARNPLFEYRGTYSEADGHIDFSWEGWSAAGPWGASGTLTEDSLSVTYNLIMQLTDFEDEVYARQR